MTLLKYTYFHILAKQQKERGASQCRINLCSFSQVWSCRQANAVGFHAPSIVKLMGQTGGSGVWSMQGWSTHCTLAFNCGWTALASEHLGIKFETHSLYYINASDDWGNVNCKELEGSILSVVTNSNRSTERFRRYQVVDTQRGGLIVVAQVGHCRHHL